MVSEVESDGRLRFACKNITHRVKQRKRQSIAMEALKKGVFRRLSISPFHQKLSAESRKLIEDRLCALVPQILDHTPDHPPYAEMIQRAIEKLEEEGGSTEASISTCIGSTYKDLPWAHSHLLPHHLRKLTEAGEIIAAPNSRYLLPLLNPSHRPEQHQQPHDDDNGDDAFLDTPITTRPPKKPRKEPSQGSQPPKGGRWNHGKKSGSEQQENPGKVQVETERIQHSLPPQQRQRGGLPWNRGGGQQTHHEEAVRNEHFDGEGKVVHPSEPPDGGSGEKVMAMEASIMENKETSQRKYGRRSQRRGQKQPKEVIDHVHCDSSTIQPIQPRPVVMEEKKPSVNEDEEPFPLLHSSSSRGELLNQPEEVRIGTSVVSCSEPTMAAVGVSEASLSNDEEPLQMVLPQSSREQVKQAETRTTASDANDSLMEDKGASASVGEDGEPFETQQQLLPSPLRDEELNHPEVGNFAADVCNHGAIVLSSGNPAVEEKEASITECRQFSQEDSMVLSIGSLTAVEDAMKEKEKSKEHPPQEQQLSLQCTDDDDDVIVSFCWNPKSVKKEKEGKPKKQSEPMRRRSLRLSEQCQHGNEAQTKPLTCGLLALPAVKSEVEEASVMEAEGKEKKKQPSQRQKKPNRKAKHLRKEKKELGTKPERSQQWQKKQKEQPKSQREEQKELGTEMESSQKKRVDKPCEEQPEEMGMETETELSQQWQKEQPKHQREEQEELGTEMEPSQKKQRGRPPKGPDLQQKQRKRGRPPKGPGFQQKQRGPKGQGGSIMKESNHLGKKTTPSRVGDVHSSKSQMAEIDQEPSETQKEARGRGRPRKEEKPEGTTIKVQGRARERPHNKQKTS